MSEFKFAARSFIEGAAFSARYFLIAGTIIGEAIYNHEPAFYDGMRPPVIFAFGVLIGAVIARRGFNKREKTSLGPRLRGDDDGKVVSEGGES